MSIYSQIIQTKAPAKDEAVSEMQATFVARAIEPMQAVPGKFDGLIGGETLPTL